MTSRKPSHSVHTANLLADVRQDLEILFTSTSESILLIETNGSIMIANNVSARWLNRSPDSLAGENLFQLLTPFGIPVREWVHKAVKNKSIFEIDSGFNDRFIHIRLIPISEGNKVKRMIVIGRDVTEQKRVEELVRGFTEQMEQKVRERTEQLEKLNEKLTEDRQRAELLASLSQTLFYDARDYRHLLDQITINISNLVGDTCLIALFTSDLTTVEIQAIADRDVDAMSQQQKSLLNHEIFIGTNIIISHILRGERYSAQYVTNENCVKLLPAEISKHLGPDGLTALEVFPLHTGDQSLGLMAVVRVKGDPYKEEEISFISSLTSSIALAIQNAGLFEKLSESHEQLRGMSKQLVQIQENQYRHLAAELHDRIGQDMTAININLNIMRELLPETISNEVLSRLNDTEELVQESVKRMRTTMSELRPPMLDQYGLSAALNWYGEQFYKRTGVKINIDDIYMKNTRLPAETEIALFRIAQEALNNVAKHAKATQIDIELFEDSGGCMMVITDNGVGANLEQHSLKSPDHWGLTIMQERARAVDGEFLMRSVPDQGTQIVVKVRCTE